MTKHDDLKQNDLIKAKCGYFDDLVEKIRTEHICRLNDYNAIQEFFGYKDFNVLLGGNLYHYEYEIDVDSSPLSLTFDQENKYGIDKSEKSGIYYKGVFVKVL